MTRKWIAILIVMTLAVGAALLPADEKAAMQAAVARGVVFDSWGYKLKVTRLESKCDVGLGKPSKKPSVYSLDLKASCKIPEDVDGVLITEQIKVKKALTANGKDIRKPPRRVSGNASSKYRSGTFTPILRLKKDFKVAQVKVSKLELLTNPFRIEKLETELAVIAAVDRADSTIPAVVSQTSRELTPGLKARVSAMRINSRRELSIEISCLRRAGGPRGPFIEAVAALDSSGKIIGQARIISGDPLGQKGKVTSLFVLSGRTEPSDLVITVVTDSKIRKIPFEITGIFQK